MVLIASRVCNGMRLFSGLGVDVNRPRRAAKSFRTHSQQTVILFAFVAPSGEIGNATHRVQSFLWHCGHIVSMIWYRKTSQNAKESTICFLQCDIDAYVC
jgi:hypothetical protein